MRICLIKELAEKEFQAMLAGAKLGGNPKDKPSKSNIMDGVPNKEQQRRGGTHQKTEKAMSFSSKVREVKITKS